MHEHFLIGRITGLQIFKVPEFGTRASFTLECWGQSSVICCVAGDVAREFVTYYREGDIIAVKGIYEPRPSTAFSKTPWAAAFASALYASRKLSALPHEAGAARTVAMAAVDDRDLRRSISRSNDRQRKACARHYCSLVVKRENQALRHLAWWSEGCGKRFPKRAHRRRHCAVSV